MGMYVNKGSGGGSHRRAYRPMSEINVTPFVDVMLVLLVIFMVTAPMLTTGVEVNRPKAKTPSVTTQKGEQLRVSILSDGKVTVSNREVKLEELGPLLVALQEAAAANGEPKEIIYVDGDAANSYGRVMEVMGAIYASGISKVALITDPPKTQNRTQNKVDGGN